MAVQRFLGNLGPRLQGDWDCQKVRVREADLEVRVARELLERAKAEGVSLVGPGGLLAGVTKMVLQAALDAEMADHLGYEKGERPPFPVGNHRNGTSPKTVLTEVGRVPLEVPRDRNGKSGPQCLSMPAGWRGSTRPSCRCMPRG